MSYDQICNWLIKCTLSFTLISSGTPVILQNEVVHIGAHFEVFTAANQHPNYSSSLNSFNYQGTLYMGWGIVVIILYASRESKVVSKAQTDTKVCAVVTNCNCSLAVQAQSGNWKCHSDR